MIEIPLLAFVAVAEDVPAEGLTRGQLGTVVDILGADSGRAFLVEFADESGEAYKFAELGPQQLLVLHRQHSDAA